jgi:LuxR family maltose regulon positive regulatory protein
MSTPVLTTKLYMPPPRPNVVPRPQLIERLNEGLQRKLTLISAPAGFGKTTLVSEWVAGGARSAAWLSLEEADNDPARFLAYLVAALQTVATTIGEGVLGALHSPQPPPTESMLTSLLNDLATLPNKIVLVLDDYHVVDAQPVDLALSFLVEHLPLQMHLVITTRDDPRLPLARLRAQGQLTELRAADLRFTADEAAAFLNEAMGLDISAHDVAALEARTEGWVAGLQLAALSIQGRDDVAGFIRAFTGDDRYIVDYLVEEVLQRQPERTRNFLLQTSILDRLSGPLCDAVTGREDSKRMLEALERGNLFVVPLDDKSLWYRYHHLFRDVLRTYAMEEPPEQVAVRHERASEWFEQHGLPVAAVRHALVGEDFARAARLIELAAPAMRRSRQEATVLGWLRALPDELIRCRPVLCAAYAGTLLANGELEGVEARLRDAERWLETMADGRERPAGSAAKMVVVDDEEFRRLPGSIAVYHAGHALAVGDVAGTVQYAERALDLAPVDDHLYRGAAAALLGLASWTSGELEAAHRSYADGMASLLRAGHIADAIGGAIALADIRIAQGRLHDAMSTYQHALQLASEHDAPTLRGTADMYVGMSGIYLERNDLDVATQHLLRSTGLGEFTGFPQNPYRWCVAMARIREAQGDLESALDLLHEAERLYAGDFYPNVRPLAALKARVWIAQGRLADAVGWARTHGLSVEDDLRYLREFEHITLARLLLARFRSEREARVMDEAIGLLERLRRAAEEGARTGSVIEILLLLALAHEAKDDIPGARAPLSRALILAEPEGYVRLFVREGAPMARLLSEGSARGLLPDYVDRLLTASDIGAPEGEHSPSHSSTSRAQQLAAPWSEREFDVLQLIAAGLSNREISERLFLALDTVKGYNRRIFAKLGVQRRTEALARAREFDLL